MEIGPRRSSPSRYDSKEQYSSKDDMEASEYPGIDSPVEQNIDVKKAHYKAYPANDKFGRPL